MAEQRMESYNVSQFDEEVIKFVVDAMIEGKEIGFIRSICRKLVERTGADNVSMYCPSDEEYTFYLIDYWSKDVKEIVKPANVVNTSQWINYRIFNDSKQGIAVTDVNTSKTWKPISQTLGVNSFAWFSLTEADECVGCIYFFSKSVREWTKEEMDLIRGVKEFITPLVRTLKRNRLEQNLLDEVKQSIVNANDIKNQFLASVSSEFRTPLSSMMGMISLAKNNKDNPDVVMQCLESLSESSTKISDMLNDCIDITLIKNDDMALEKVNFKMREIFDEVERIVRISADTKNLKIEFSGETGCLLRGDKDKIVRVLVNIISNSIHHTSENGIIKVSIKYECSYGFRAMYSLRVRDYGEGMPDEIVEKIFEPFASVEQAGRVVVSTGLGMAVSRYLVELMNGSINIYSTVGEGTEVIIELPLEEMNENGEHIHLEEEPDDTSFVELYLGRRILLVEDSALQAEILSEMLGRKGLNIERAVNGKDGFEMYLQSDPFYYDMILMDIQMPIMNGIDATKAIRNSDKADAKLIPIVGMTADAFNINKSNMLKVGMNDCLIKLIKEKELAKVISTLVM